MAIKRIIKVELGDFDSTWKNSYIKVATRGFMDQMQFQKDITKIEKKLKRTERSLSKAQKKLETTDSESLLIEEDKLTDDLLAKTEQMMKAMQEFVTSRFVEGKIFDYDDQKEREMRKEDILQFDNQVLMHINTIASGELGKKD